MEVKTEITEKKVFFFIENNGQRVATMSCTFAGPTKLIIDHTEVNPSEEGKGLGKLLVKAVVEFARERQIKLLPLCPYAKSVFDKTPDYNDVLF